MNQTPKRVAPLGPCPVVGSGSRNLRGLEVRDNFKFPPGKKSIWTKNETINSLIQQIDRTPNGLSIYNARTGGHDDTQKADHTKPNRNRDQLRKDSCSWSSGTRSKIGCVDDEGGHIRNAGHERCDHFPGKVGAVNGCWLANDWTNPLRLDNGPDEEDDSGNWNADRFSCEEMATRRIEIMRQLDI
jgi:hypothetical protein